MEKNSEWSVWHQLHVSMHFQVFLSSDSGIVLRESCLWFLIQGYSVIYFVLKRKVVSHYHQILSVILKKITKRWTFSYSDLHGLAWSLTASRLLNFLHISLWYLPKCKLQQPVLLSVLFRCFNHFSCTLFSHLEIILFILQCFLVSDFF
jgi:hypothetical protein